MTKPLLLILTLIPALVLAQKKTYPPEIPNAEAKAYKKVGDVELKLWVFKPEGWKASEKRPAIVFFFGGGWRAGSPAQFIKQCEHLAKRGMVAMTADYRVLSLATKRKRMSVLKMLGTQCVGCAKMPHLWASIRIDSLLAVGAQVATSLDASARLLRTQNRNQTQWCCSIPHAFWLLLME